MVGLHDYVETYRHDTYSALDKAPTSGSCSGKVVFITGAGTGIGKATARAFAAASARAIFVAGRTESTLASTKSEIQKAFPDTFIEYFVLDICDGPKVEAAFRSAVEKAKGPVDILVNNAAYISYMETMGDFNKIWTHFDVNVRGFLLVVQEFLKHTIEKGATLINVSSGAAVIEDVPGLSPYGASKLATLKFMDYLHNEEKDRRGLRVFSIQPGNVATAMAQEGKTVCDDSGMF